MKKEIADRWTAALRSGEYLQGTRCLCLIDKDTGNKLYCCLGVLCDLHAKETNQSWETDDNNMTGNPRVLAYQNAAKLLPGVVSAWADMKTCRKYGMPMVKDTYLMVLNDVERLTFNEIADLIEQHWETI